MATTPRTADRSHSHQFPCGSTVISSGARLTAETGSISLLFSNSIERPGQCVIRNHTYRGTVPRGRDGKAIIQIVLADETFRSRKRASQSYQCTDSAMLGNPALRKGYARFRFPRKQACLLEALRSVSPARLSLDHGCPFGRYSNPLRVARSHPK